MSSQNQGPPAGFQQSPVPLPPLPTPVPQPVTRSSNGAVIAILVLLGIVALALFGINLQAENLLTPNISRCSGWLYWLVQNSPPIPIFELPVIHIGPVSIPLGGISELDGLGTGACTKVPMPRSDSIMVNIAGTILVSLVWFFTFLPSGLRKIITSSPLVIMVCWSLSTTPVLDKVNDQYLRLFLYALVAIIYGFKGITSLTSKKKIAAFGQQMAKKDADLAAANAKLTRHAGVIAAHEADLARAIQSGQPPQPVQNQQRR